MTHHTDTTYTSCNIYMIISKQTITTLKRHLAITRSHSLLFLHALSGCDPSSRPYGIGKVTVVTKSEALTSSTSVFMSASVTKDDIEKAGEAALM